MAFGKYFIPSLIGFNSLTRPSFKHFCMSVTGLKSFESSYCVLKSLTPSDKKLCWMFCSVLRSSLTIIFLFFESVIFRLDMFFISYILIFFEHGFEHGFERGLNTVLNMVLNMVWTRFWTWFWTQFRTWFWTCVQVAIVVVFRLSKALASVSILLVF